MITIGGHEHLFFFLKFVSKKNSLGHSGQVDTFRFAKASFERMPNKHSKM
jgi:hypothetical protein